SQYQSPRRRMACGRAVVNERMSLFRPQKLRDIGRTDFQFERRGYTVERFDSLAFNLLPVLVQVNEAGSDHQPAGVDHATSGQGVGGNAGNLSIANANAA